MAVAGEAEGGGLETAQAQARVELESAQGVRSKREVEAAEVRVAGQHVEQQIRERLAIEPAQLLEEGPLEPAQETEGSKEGKQARKDDVIDVEALDIRQLRALSLDVQGKIDRLGPVNLVAYDDFEVQEARHQELGAQRTDLKAAAANLGEAIERIDVDCIERFTECFESVNGYFNRIFRQLFGGGKAGMKLDDPEDPLNSGIEIFAQPPGKKLQNIRLLSGGERTLVALSLLFGIFEYRPAAPSTSPTSIASSAPCIRSRAAPSSSSSPTTSARWRSRTCCTASRCRRAASRSLSPSSSTRGCRHPRAGSPPASIAISVSEIPAAPSAPSCAAV